MMVEEIDFLDVLNERAASGKPILVVEPEIASEELIELLKNTLPDEKKHHVKFVNLDAASGKSADPET